MKARVASKVMLRRLQGFRYDNDTIARADLRWTRRLCLTRLPCQCRAWIDACMEAGNPPRKSWLRAAKVTT